MKARSVVARTVLDTTAGKRRPVQVVTSYFRGKVRYFRLLHLHESGWRTYVSSRPRYLLPIPVTAIVGSQVCLPLGLT